jgi:hypothetical protein
MIFSLDDDNVKSAGPPWGMVNKFLRKFGPTLSQKLKNTSSPIFFKFFPLTFLLLVFIMTPILAILSELLQRKKLFSRDTPYLKIECCSF